jgi:hypothetical protein
MCRRVWGRRTNHAKLKRKAAEYVLSQNKSRRAEMQDGSQNKSRRRKKMQVYAPGGREPAAVGGTWGSKKKAFDAGQSKRERVAVAEVGWRRKDILCGGAAVN